MFAGYCSNVVHCFVQLILPDRHIISILSILSSHFLTLKSLVK